MTKFSDPQILVIMRLAKGGVPLSERRSSRQYAQRQFLWVVGEV